MAPEPSKGPALVAVMRQYKWTNTVMLISADKSVFPSGNALTQQLQAAGVRVLKPAAFVDFQEAVLDDIKRSGFRIIIIVAWEQDAHAAALSAERKGMIAGYAWISASERNALLEMQGWLYVQPVLPSHGMQVFAQQVKDYGKSHFNLSISVESVDLTYSAALFDAILLYAHAATRVLSEGGDLNDGKAVTATLRSTRFEGIGNRVVALDELGDRVTSYELGNYVVGADGGISRVLVGIYNSTARQYSAYEQAVVWPGNLTEVPLSYLSGDDMNQLAMRAPCNVMLG